MTDDIIDQLSYYVTNEMRMPAGLIVTVINEIEAHQAEIERLRENIQYLHDVIASLRGEIREMEDSAPNPPPQGTPIGSKLLTAQPPRKVNP